MTFASDRISANQETLAKQRYEMQSKERIARTSRFSFDPEKSCSMSVVISLGSVPHWMKLKTCS